VIEAQALTRVFGERTVVDRVSLRLGPGQLCALLGPNGAGKTTTVRMLLGLVRPTTGSAVVANVTIPGSSESLAGLRAKVGLLTETPGFYDRLSARENLTLFGGLYRIGRSELSRRIDDYLQRLGLADRRDDPIATFSKGMKQRLAIIRAVFHDPEVVFFDEPTAGLDPESARDVRRLIVSLKHAGRTILVCTHNLAEAAELADVIGVLNRELVAFGPPATLGRAPTAPRLRVVVDRDALRAVAALASLAGVTAEATSATDLELTVADPDTLGPAIVRCLVEAGFGIREVRRVEPSLEEIYLEAIGTGGS
jgi:ABC-2 type transport system ATP-binding protein